MVGMLNLYQTDFLSNAATKIAGANVSPDCTVALVRSDCKEVKLPSPKPLFAMLIVCALVQLSLGGAWAYSLSMLLQVISNSRRHIFCIAGFMTELIKCAGLKNF
jgi:hypothetical protein